MASYQVIQPGEGFASGFGQGLSSGAGNASNMYAQAMYKKMFNQQAQKQQDDNFQKYLAIVKDSGQPINYKYTPNGIGFETRDPEDLKPADLSMGLYGMANDTKTKMMADRLGAKPNDIAMLNPNAAMSLASGGVGDVNENQINPSMDDTRKYVAAAFKDNPYMKSSREASSIDNSRSFADDYKTLMDSSSSEEELRNGLNELSSKYADDPQVLSSITKILKVREGYRNKGGSASHKPSIFDRSTNATTP